MVEMGVSDEEVGNVLDLDAPTAKVTFDFGKCWGLEVTLIDEDGCSVAADEIAVLVSAVGRAVDLIHAGENLHACLLAAVARDDKCGRSVSVGCREKQ
ncbi:MAG: hypothetical protein AVDCRST_MAG93-7578 [uncultured Chloroflexia bacterium]|uniref:Uncharacterized protein n=1 Tax=uncultured Chloroflexia bacterium TaxID=1672391 RepID=A0A6J4MJZ6_9CHLR|nr:MAG: hypothetical protein AVDCRST_MAG93-7578 [uncultured Chloroflexia bacterium]